MVFSVLKIVADWAITESQKDSNNAEFRAALLRLATVVIDVMKFC